jgi:uncharacterized membrane protein YedE/YeeE
MLVYALIAGIAFGALLSRVGASSPGMIAKALRLQDFTIIKFMFTAIATMTLGAYLLDSVGQAHLSIKPLYTLGIALGGLLFGIGFAVAGYCPGTCIVGAGEGRRDAMAAVAGGVVGALCYTLAYPVVAPALIAPFDQGPVTLASVLHLPPLATAAALAAVLAAAILVMDRIDRRRRQPVVQPIEATR